MVTCVLRNHKKCHVAFERLPGGLCHFHDVIFLHPEIADTWNYRSWLIINLSFRLAIVFQTDKLVTNRLLQNNSSPRIKSNLSNTHLKRTISLDCHKKGSNLNDKFLYTNLIILIFISSVKLILKDFEYIFKNWAMYIR